MLKSKDTVIIIPTLNEAEAIGLTLDDVLQFVAADKIVLIDSYSNDGTVDIALDKGVNVLDAPRGGKGKALRSVLPYLLSKYKAKYYIMIDGDYTYPAKYIPGISILLSGCDVVIGSRDGKEKGSMTIVNKFGNYMLSLVATLLYQQVYDVCSGMWGFRREVLKKYKLSSDGFTLEADLFVNTYKNRCRLEQLPIDYRSRPNGSRTKLTVLDGFRIGWFLIRNRFK